MQVVSTNGRVIASANGKLMASPSGGEKTGFVLVSHSGNSQVHSFTVDCSTQLACIVHCKSRRTDVESVRIFHCERSETSILVVSVLGVLSYQSYIWITRSGSLYQAVFYVVCVSVHYVKCVLS